MNERIGRLEALLARIKSNAALPRMVHVEAMPVAVDDGPETPRPVHPTATVPPSADARAALAEERHAEPAAPVEREIEVPLESRARLVAAPHSEPPEEISADDVLELDDRHIIPDATAAAPDVDVNAATTEMSAVDESKKAAEEEGPPPSSRRPIAEPAETPQEAQIQVTHTPPPESGKQVASDALSFDDDFTGVREAAVPRVNVPAPDPSIALQSIRSPEAPKVQPPDEMEVELPHAQPPGEFIREDATRPPPGPLPDLHAPPPPAELVAAAPTELVAEVSRPTRPVAAAHVAEMAGQVAAAAPKTFGELLDLTLSL